MNIYLPSYNRFQEKQCHTLRFLQGLTGRKVYLVVRTEQEEAYRRLCRQLGSKARILTVEEPGVLAARNRCLKHCQDDDQRAMLMMDDDLSFAERTPEKRLLKLQDPNPLCDRVERHLQRYAHVAISNRFGNVFEERDEVEGVRGVRCVGYRVDVLARYHLQFELAGREGMHMTLRLFRHHYPNLVLYQYAQESVERSVFERDGHSMLDWTNQSAKELEALHPGIVKVVQKQYKSGPRGEVRVNWRLALQQPFRYLGPRPRQPQEEEVS